MSVELVKKEIFRFLETEIPEAMVIKGKWGVGKTYSWRKFLEEAKKKNEIKQKHYSYVSLFGLENLADLKNSIFETRISVENIGREPTLKDFKLNLDALKEGFPKIWQPLRGLNFFIQNEKFTTTAAYMFVKKDLICIDDLERRGGELEIRDVLGLVSQLKEQKKCKVVLILNDDAFTPEEEKDFKKYLEKAIDFEIEFAPTAEECAKIALSGEDYISRTLSDLCSDLGLKNIRVIKKIERLAKIIIPIVERNKFEKEVLYQALHTLTLLGWSYYSHGEEVIKFDYIKQFGSNYMGLSSDEELSDKHKKWNTKLGSYAFNEFDGFDDQIAFAVENGYLGTEFLEQAEALNKQVVANKADNSFRKAWGLYHDSFDDNEKEVVESLYSSFIKNYDIITPLNVNGTVSLLRELGYNKEADKLIEHYFANKEAEQKFFDLASGFFSEGDKIDPKFSEAMKKKYETFSSKLNLKDVLLHINKSKSWGEEHISFLVGCKEKDFYDLFKTEKGKNLRSVIHGCLDFETIQNPKEDWLKISKKARKALEKIGKESKLNKRRVKKYGVFI